MAFAAHGDRRRMLLSKKPAGSSTSITVDLWQTFEFDTISGANFDANDNTSTGSWSVTDTGAQLSTSSTGQKSFTSLINGSSDSGTRGMAKVYTSAATASPTFDIGSGNTKANVSHSFWFRYSGNPTINKRVSLLYGTSTECLRADFQYLTDTIGFNGGANSNGVALSENTFYRIEIDFTQNATCYGRVYSVMDAQVGDEFTATGANQAMRYWQIFGSAEAVDSGITLYWDNLIIDWTDATYPLGP